MPYLIDGHNLIAQTPGISLEDPDDEAKLVMLLRRFCLREKRKATVIFDGGLPGGLSSLSNSTVTVIFASDRHTTADDLLINRIRAEHNPNAMIVVSTDQKVANAARQRRMTVKASAEFAKLLTAANQKSQVHKKDTLSEDEVAEWEAMFKAKAKQERHKDEKKVASTKPAK
jgi:predicted RNA-binding protein with PIN domain